VIVTRCKSAAADIRRERLNVADRREADIADWDDGRRIWADSAPTGVASGRTGVRAKAAVPLRARNGLHRGSGPSVLAHVPHVATQIRLAGTPGSIEGARAAKRSAKSSLLALSSVAREKRPWFPRRAEPLGPHHRLPVGRLEMQPLLSAASAALTSSVSASAASSVCALAITGISGVGDKPSSAGARTAWASTLRSVV
jgi:hypothetical protein